MATPFLMGLGVASAAMVARMGLVAAERMAANPEYMKQAGAAAAGVKGMGNVFRKIPETIGLGNLFAAETATGFNATMNRTEAAKILGVRYGSSLPCELARQPTGSPPPQRSFSPEPPHILAMPGS